MRLTMADRADPYLLWEAVAELFFHLFEFLTQLLRMLSRPVLGLLADGFLLDY